MYIYTYPSDQHFHVYRHTVTKKNPKQRCPIIECRDRRPSCVFLLGSLGRSSACALLLVLYVATAPRGLGLLTSRYWVQRTKKKRAHTDVQPWCGFEHRDNLAQSRACNLQCACEGICKASPTGLYRGGGPALSTAPRSLPFSRGTDR